MDCVLVDDLGGLAARLHHHATTHSVEGIGHDASNGCHNLGDGPADVDGCVLGVGQHTASGIVEAEVGGTVDDDALDRHTEAAVQADKAVALEDLGQAVAQTGEFTLTTLASISSQAVFIFGLKERKFVITLALFLFLSLSLSKLTEYEQSPRGRQSTERWHQRHHRRPGYRRSNARTGCSCQHLPGRPID